MRSHTAALRGAVRGALLALHGLIPQKGPYLPPPPLEITKQRPTVVKECVSSEHTLMNWDEDPGLVPQHPRPLSIVHGGRWCLARLRRTRGDPPSFPRLLHPHARPLSAHFTYGGRGPGSRFLLQCLLPLKFSVSHETPSTIALKLTDSRRFQMKNQVC